MVASRPFKKVRYWFAFLIPAGLSVAATVEAKGLPSCRPPPTVGMQPILARCQPTVESLTDYPVYCDGTRTVSACQRVVSEDKITQGVFDAAIESHQKWLSGAEDGVQLNLCGEKLSHLTIPSKVNLSRAILSSTDISGLDFSETILEEAGFCHAIMKGTHFKNATAPSTVFWFTNAEGSQFQHADLKNASFAGADLKGANLWDTDLQGAHLENVLVEGLRLAHVDFTNLRFIPLSGEPEPYLGNAQNIGRLHPDSYPRGFSLLHALAVKSRDTILERDLHAQIARYENARERHISGLTDVIPATGAWVSAIFIGIPTDWGRRPWIPLCGLAVAFMVFTAIYYFRIRRKTGDVFILLPTGSLKYSSQNPSLRKDDEVHPPIGGRLSILKYAYLLSLQATFFFMSDSLRVSNWINRLNPVDEALVTTGKSRVLTGVQSIFSLYALTLWLATTFGRS